MDSDDILNKDALYTLVQKAEHDNLERIHFERECFTEEEKQPE